MYRGTCASQPYLSLFIMFSTDYVKLLWKFCVLGNVRYIVISSVY